MFSLEEKEEAEYFAVCFIAPEHLFKKISNKHYDGKNWNVLAISKELGLAYRQTLERGVELKVWKEIIPN